mgnify:FL=1
MKKGDRLPDISFRTRSLGEWKDVSTDDYFKGKRVILFALPGAFTPTCSNQQLPGYEKLHDVFKQHGIDEVYCLSINDSYVMNAWAANQKLEKVKVIPDGNGDFTDQVDMLVEKSDCGFGMRSWRYAMIVNDGTVEVMFEEPGKQDNNDGDPYSVSSPENVLKYLQSMANQHIDKKQH